MRKKLPGRHSLSPRNTPRRRDAGETGLAELPKRGPRPRALRINDGIDRNEQRRLLTAREHVQAHERAHQLDR